MTPKEKLKELADDFAKGLASTVEKIEASPETTQGHYGDYMSFLANFENPYRLIVARALIQAGASRTGVQNAITYGG